MSRAIEVEEGRVVEESGQEVSISLINFADLANDWAHFEILRHLDRDAGKIMAAVIWHRHRVTPEEARQYLMAKCSSEELENQ